MRHGFTEARHISGKLIYLFSKVSFLMRRALNGFLRLRLSRCELSRWRYLVIIDLLGIETLETSESWLAEKSG